MDLPVIALHHYGRGSETLWHHRQSATAGRRDSHRDHSDDKEIRAEISAHMKLLPPSIMAKLVIFLCSDEAYGITGERIVVTDFDVWLNARSNSLASFEKKNRVTSGATRYLMLGMFDLSRHLLCGFL